ncbi:copper amine oxidase N-terminal domain-containing protein [Paenibacillus sp. XY044]|uniref:copper amine oxidase N-terminal domain-containing protein n=1 Tax=Paenibacillus sp. XY044 TaxID=2026089 RepID=UPI000B97D061|nr:copper amine oxidase N-terminal domain-containing protein [Paenibacillus sp. XY044]OZB95186.1 hypothetical protein CJP46_15970 [Paenibacillus sp. XY044]
MKKFIWAISAACLLMSGSSAYAAVPDKVYMENVEVPDAAPVLKDGRVLVPLRTLANSIQASVSWDAKTQTATVHKWSEKVVIPLGKNAAVVKQGTWSTKIKLDVPMQRIHNQMYVPLRLWSEWLGYRLEVKGTAVSFQSPLNPMQLTVLDSGDLADARRMMLDMNSRLHYEHERLDSQHTSEGFSTIYLFPRGVGTRYYVIYDNLVSRIELKGGMQIVTWQAHISPGERPVEELFAQQKFTDATGPLPWADTTYFYYREGSIVNINTFTAGRLDPDGKLSKLGYKQTRDGEIQQQSGSLTLKLPDEVRTDVKH